MKRLLRECDLTLSEAISADYDIEETRQHSREILRSPPTANINNIFKSKLNKSSHDIRNQSTRVFKKSLTFVIVHIPEANAQLIEKFVMQ